MRPPSCAVCGATSAPPTSSPTRRFEIVRFVDFDPPGDSRPGGPWPGSDWFCPHHAGRAKALAGEGATLSDALMKMVGAE